MRDSLSLESDATKHNYQHAEEQVMPRQQLWRIAEDVDDENNDVDLSLEDINPCSSEPSPLLPVHHKHALSRPNFHGDRSTLSSSRPTSMMSFTILVFVLSSTAYHILSRFNLYEATYKFPFPLSLCLLQFIFCDLAIVLWSVASYIILRIQPQLKSLHYLQAPLEWQSSEARRFIPISMTFLISWAATLSCLEYLPMNSAVLFLAPMMLLQLSLTKWASPETMQSIYVAASCMLLMLGYILTSITTKVVNISSFNIPGLLAGLLASVAVPVHHCLVKKTLPSVSNNLFQLAHYVLITASAIILPLVIISGEIFEIEAHCFFLDEKGFWLMILLLCAVSLLSFGSQLLLVAYTTPLTVTVLYFLRTTLLQIPFSDWLNHSGLQWYNYAGMVISILGALGYVYHSDPHRPRWGLPWLSQ